MEIRGCNCKARGWIALIESGGTLNKQTKLVQGKIVGVARIVDSRPLSVTEYKRLEARHQAGTTELPYNTTHGWFLKDVVALNPPMVASRKQGSIVWSRLQPATTLAIGNRLQH